MQVSTILREFIGMTTISHVATSGTSKHKCLIPAPLQYLQGKRNERPVRKSSG